MNNKQKDFQSEMRNSMLDSIANSLMEQSFVLEHLQELKQMELEHRDRVDISLSKYEQMKSDIRELRAMVEHYKEIFEKTKMSRFINIIDPKTTTAEVITSNEDGRTKVKISFNIDNKKLLEK